MLRSALPLSSSSPSVLLYFHPSTIIATPSILLSFPLLSLILFSFSSYPPLLSHSSSLLFFQVILISHLLLLLLLPLLPPLPLHSLLHPLPQLPFNGIFPSYATSNSLINPPNILYASVSSYNNPTLFKAVCKILRIEYNSDRFTSCNI